MIGVIKTTVKLQKWDMGCGLCDEVLFHITTDTVRVCY